MVLAGATRLPWLEQEWGRIADLVPQILWVAGPDGSTSFVNRQGVEYAGEWPGADGWALVALVHPGDAERAQRDLAHAIATKTVHRSEYRIRRVDGEFRRHEYCGVPAWESDGSAWGWVCSATDVEDHRRSEEELRAAERATAETITLLDTLEASAPVGFGFIDPEFRVVRVNGRLAAVNGMAVQDQIGRRVPDLVPDLWGQLEPIYRKVLEGETISNLETSGRTADDPGRTHHWLSSHFPVRMGDRIIGIGVVAVDITDRHEAALARDQLTDAAVAAIAAIVDARDPYTAGHMTRVAVLSAAIATEMGLDADTVAGIHLSANIHDIGKAGIPTEILVRPGKLRDVEWELIKTHARTGHDIIAGIDFRWPVAEMILQHHERLDGSGYPQGLRGDEIITGARVIAVADTVEAMSSHRPYRASLGIDGAIAEIRQGRGTLYDPDVVDACVRLYQRGDLSRPVPD